MLSERSQMQKVTYLMVSFIYEMSRIIKSMETESKSVVAGAKAGGNGEWLFNGHSFLFWGGKKFQELG